MMPFPFYGLLGAIMFNWVPEFTTPLTFGILGIGFTSIALNHYYHTIRVPPQAMFEKNL
jgi:hypothetical protein